MDEAVFVPTRRCRHVAEGVRSAKRVIVAGLISALEQRRNVLQKQTKYALVFLIIHFKTVNTNTEFRTVRRMFKLQKFLSS